MRMTSAPAPVAPPPVVQQHPPLLVSDAFAKDAIIAWYRGEFAAANAIIDALCTHLAQLGGSPSEYEAVFTAIHRRRLNWIPVLQMQKYHSIADVAVELSRVTTAKTKKKKKSAVVSVDDDKGGIDVDDACGEISKDNNDKVSCDVHENEDREEEKEKEKVVEGEVNESNNNGGEREVVDVEGDSAPGTDITDSGSQEAQSIPEKFDICSNHENCDARSSQIKLTKGFSAKESVKGHMVNVVKGLKMYDDIFTESELSKLTDFINELRVAGQNGELSGETFILFNKQVKGKRRELIQFGLPIFEHIHEDDSNNKQTSNLEPIPPLLQSVIDHLVQWNLIPVYKMPDSCIINFFDEDEYSQPFQKPPHLDQPISTLFLSESNMAFGRCLVSDNEGNYKGPLMLSVKEGSLLVMRGNSADMARHVMCSSPTKRTAITFFRIKPDSYHGHSSMTPSSPDSMSLWQAGSQSPYATMNEGLNGYCQVEMMPKWGVLHAPVVMLAPPQPMVLSPKKIQNGGTGVFLPWAVRARKPAKHLPPRAQKGRLLALPSPPEESSS